MNDYKSLWKFRDACLNNSLEEMHTICTNDPSFIERENPEDLDFSLLARVYQIQVSSRQGELQKVKTLIGEYPNLVNQSWSSEKWTPLHQATTAEALPVFKYLLSKGADVNQRQSDGTSVLQIAKSRKNDNFIDFLVSQGAIE